MQTMDEKAIRDFISDWSWCTIVGTDGAMPYAIEVTYVTDGTYMYCGSRPGGTMHRCLKKNRNIILKICDADRTYQQWRAATVRGQAEFITDRDEIYRILRMIAKIRDKEENSFDGVAEFILNNPEGSSLFRLPIRDFSGVADL
jgi:nitroimidazol reductase NimA-like FMN-containing flavoprotein (pyridoxamine 5'-phosphate oxidase superfamily)